MKLRAAARFVWKVILAELMKSRDQVESANVTWDVVDLTQADSLRACEEGLLENLSDVSLPDGKDGTKFRDDFVDGALNECGVGVIVWATAFAYNRDAFSKFSGGSDAPSDDCRFLRHKKSIQAGGQFVTTHRLSWNGH